MLQTIRGTAGSWVVKILFIFLIISFGAWGIGNVNTSFSQWVAKVGDAEISPVELDTAFREEVDRLRQSFGPELTAAQVRQLGLLDQTLEQLVQRKLVTQAAADYGLRITPEMAAAEVREIPAFRDPVTGNFDATTMRMVLAQNGLSEQRLLNDVQADMARVQVLGAVARGAAMPLTLAGELYRYRGERRVVDTLLVKDAAMPDPGNPDEATVSQYHQDKAVRYTAPEYRTVTVATLGAEALAKEVTLTDEDLRQAYDQRVDEFVTPERRDLDQVVVDSKEKADKVAAAVAGGKSLADAAREAGAEAVPLEGVVKADLPAELAAPVFAAAANAVAGPVESPLGWHVVVSRKVTPGGERPFEEVKAQLEQTVRTERATDLMYERANQLDDAVSGGANLEEAAAKVGATVTKLDKIDNQGRTPAGQPAQGVPGLARIAQAAFAAPANEVTGAAEADAGVYFALRVDGVTPAALRPLAEVRQAVVADWKAEKRADAAAAKAKELADKLKAGGDPVKLAKEAGAVHSRPEPLTRGGNTNGAVPPGLTEEIFTLPVNGVASGDAPEGHMAVRVAEVLAADPAASLDQVNAARVAAVDTVAGDLVQQFLAGLRQRYPVERNETTLQQMYGSEEP